MYATGGESGAERRRCQMHKNEKASFCNTHRLICCASCHKATYVGCRMFKVSDAVKSLHKEVGACEEQISKNRSKLSVRRDALSGSLGKVEEKEQNSVNDVSRFYSQIRDLVNFCELTTLEKVREICLKEKAETTRQISEINAMDGILAEEVLLTTKNGSAVKVPPDSEATVSVGDSGVNLNDQDLIFFESSASETKSKKALPPSNDVYYLSARVIELSQISKCLEKLLLNTSKNTTCENLIKIDKGIYDNLKATFGQACLVLKPITFQKTGVIPFKGERPSIKHIWKDGVPFILLTVYAKNSISLCSLNQGTDVSIALTSTPHDFCILDDTIYVTVPTKNVIWAYNIDTLALIDVLKFTDSLYGIDAMNDLLVVSSRDKSGTRIKTMTKAGITLKESVHEFQSADYLCFVPATNSIFVTDNKKNEIVILDGNLQHIVTMTYIDLHKPMGLKVMKSSVYVCGRKGQSDYSVTELSNDGSYIRRVLDSSDGLKTPCSIDYDEVEGKLFVAQFKGSDGLGVFEAQ